VMNPHIKKRDVRTVSSKPYDLFGSAIFACPVAAAGAVAIECVLHLWSLV